MTRRSGTKGPREETHKLEPRKTAAEIARLADEKLAEDITVIEVKGLSSVADYLVICTGGSDTQVRAIVENINDGMRKLGEKPLGVEGVEDGRWALMDFVDVVAHVFYRPVREHYDIEGLWADAPRVEVFEGGGDKGEEGA